MSKGGTILELERILGTDKGREAFYKADRNFVAIEEALNNVSGDAASIAYDNTTSGMTATDVQAAVDELRTQNNNLYANKANKAHPDWITGTLQNGATGFIQYRQNQIGQIEVKGSVALGTVAANTIIATLPIGYRPSDYEVINLLNISTTLQNNNIGITSNGEIYIMNTTGLSTSNTIAFRKIFFTD